MLRLNAGMEESSGGSPDEEAANLRRYQKSCEAAARLIKVKDELFETLLNIS